MRAWNRKNHTDFCEQLKEKNILFEPLEEYIDAKTKIKFKCQKCGHIWKARPTNILMGKGCPKCKIKNAHDRYVYSQSEFVNKVKEKNPNIEILSQYTGNKNKLYVRCKKHGNEWWTVPSVILKGSGCHECMNEKIAQKNGRSHEEFLEIARKNSPHIEILGKYKNAKTKIKVRCKLHDEIYYVTPDLIVHGSGNCPKCNYTVGEYKVANYLDYKGYEYIPQYSFQTEGKIKNKRFDFYIPSAQTCIEYDGIQHFEPVEIFGEKKSLAYTKKNDEIKNEFCKQNHINLIRIPYTVSDVGQYLKDFGI